MITKSRSGFAPYVSAPRYLGPGQPHSRMTMNSVPQCLSLWLPCRAVPCLARNAHLLAGTLPPSSPLLVVFKSHPQQVLSILHSEQRFPPTAAASSRSCYCLAGLEDGKGGGRERAGGGFRELSRDPQASTKLDIQLHTSCINGGTM